MSSRNGRRHRKKTEDDPSFRPPSSKKEEIKVKHVEANTITEKVTLTEENNVAKVKMTEPPPIIVSTVDITESDNTEVTETKCEVTNGNNGHNEDVPQMQVEVVETEVVHSEPELEPLVVDSEEQELQFDDNSDIDSHKGSPILTNRCATRRSQTRNIPTPKTPRVHDQNGDTFSVKDDKEQNISEQNEVCEKPKEPQFEPITMETPPPTEENLDVVGVVVKEPNSSDDLQGTEENQNLNLSVQSCESALSTQVNVGGDVTREIDLTLPDESSFLNTAKDMNVVETLRRMSSRRAIRSGSSDYRKTLLKSQAEKHEFVLQQQRASTERVPASKRKTRSKTPENPKRFKSESSPGFFSYISSPLSMLRNRFSSGESMSASTPKLTGYREQEAMEDPELSKIEDTTKVPAEKKRCVIM